MLDVPQFLLLLTAREGCLCPETPGSPNSLLNRRAVRAAALVYASIETGAPADDKTGKNAVIYSATNNPAVQGIPANGDNPLNFVSHARGSLQFWNERVRSSLSCCPRLIEYLNFLYIMDILRPLRGRNDV
jgi:hypothetical protein